MSPNERDDLMVSIGIIRRPHGRKGELSCIITDDQWQAMQELDVITVGPGTESGVRSLHQDDVVHEVDACRGRPERAVLKLRDVADHASAQALTGQTLWTRRGQLTAATSQRGDGIEAMDLLRADLLNLQARDESGEALGVVFDVLQYPAHSVLAIADDEHPDLNACKLVPYTDAAILEVNMTAGTIIVNTSALVDNG